jgi:hypothetical protein
MSNFNDEVCEFNPTPTNEHFAAKNGGGIVYHRSDCGNESVRMYASGGDWSGSACGSWLDPELTKIVHNVGFKNGAPGDHNWTYCELTKASHEWYYPQSPYMGCMD